MDLKSLGKLVVGFGLETVGTALGGPLGGAVAGKVADALGAGTSPQDIADKITADPAAAQEKLIPLETDPAIAAASEAYWQAVQTQSSEVNATMRAELTAQGWMQRTWRPFFGMVFTLVYGGIGAAIVRAVWVGNFQVVEAIAALTVYIGAGAAVLGVYVHGRSNEKLTAMTGERNTGIVGAVVKRIAGG